MCGIVGFVDYEGLCGIRELEEMVSALAHRGPDASGTELIRVGTAVVGLGHTRLSIIDLSPNGAQPMWSLSRRGCIVYNGEVYNHASLRPPLESTGTSFRSTSDTEVVLESHLQKGPDAAKDFLGMFAYALLEPERHKLSLVRDRAGVKPLYVAQFPGLVLFGSELKALMTHPGFRKTLSLEGLSHYFERGYIPAPLTPFEGVTKLMPGTHLTLDLETGKSVEETYWSVHDAYARPPLVLPDEEALTQLSDLLEDAFALRMVADVPVGVFLSGGFDSTAVTALLQQSMTSRLRTFTVGFDQPEWDESAPSRAIADFLGTEHTEVVCTSRDLLELIPKTADIYDEPFADASGMPTLLVSRMARQEVKVALSADGGDETFGGYSRYAKALDWFSYSSRLPEFLRGPGARASRWVAEHPGLPSRLLGNVTGRFTRLAEMLEARYPHDGMELFSGLFTPRERRRLIPDAPEPLPPWPLPASLARGNLDPMLEQDYVTYLTDDICHKVDRASMAVSLEAREPLLDHRIIEFAARLPAHQKIRNGESKWLLKQLVRSRVPAALVDRPKRGFGVPLRRWLKNELADLMQDTLSPANIRKHGLLSPEAVDRTVREFLSGQRHEADQVWALIAFQLWMDRWL